MTRAIPPGRVETTTRVRTVPKERQATATTRAESHPAPTSVLALLLLALVGVALIAVSDTVSARASGGHAFYAVFWAGMLVFLLPAAVALARSATGRNARCALVVAVGLFTFVPKYLRNPGGPAFHDELAHWREAQDIASSGHLFQPNSLIPLIRDFPGLESATNVLHTFTGLSVWTCGVLIVGLAHVLTLLAVFLLVEGFHGARAGGIGVLVYTANAGFLYFDTQYAYQSFALLLVAWTLVCVQRVYRADRAGERWSWAALALLFGGATVVTHHLSALALGVVLLVVALLATAQSMRRPGSCPAWGASWAVLGGYAAVAALWATLAAPGVVGYLSPYLGPAVRALDNRLSGSKQGSRQLFTHNPLPLYERWAALALPVIVLLLTAAALWWFLRHRARDPRTGPLAAGLALMGLLYFVSLPFLLTSIGAEGGRRTWSFSFIGLAVLLAPVVVALLRRAAGARPRTRVSVAALCTALFTVSVVGGVAAGQAEDYRFPRPYAYGYDARSLTPEEHALAQWMLSTYGPGQRIVADDLTAQNLAALARARPATASPGFPYWDLYFHNGPPSRALARELALGRYRFLVIDEQLARGHPFNHTYFGPHEPVTASGRPYVITAAALAQYDHHPWTTKVYASSHFAVYRFDQAALDAMGGR